MSFPPGFIQSLQGIASFNEPSFIKAHEDARSITSIRVNPLRNFWIEDFNHKSQTTNHNLSKVPWTQYGYYLPVRPSFTFDPLFHAGCYYVQEASSMFLEQALKQTVDLSSPLKVLDLSAAPGGKSTHIQSLISADSLLISNEVIRSRANILKDNIIKWGTDNVVVTNNDPSEFGAFQNYFDVIVLDAPCSGSGLFRRDPGAMQEWSESNVVLCSQRQQRILADILPALRQDGILIYSTCSYSTEENESISEWIMQSFPLTYRPLNIEADWNIIDTGKGYRFWPDKTNGEGFFLACFQKVEQGEPVLNRTRNILDHATGNEQQMLKTWIKDDSLDFWKKENTVYAWPEIHSEEFNYALNHLRVIYSGILAGELVRDKFIPEHPLALSRHLSDNVPRLELNIEQAIAYLQRKPPQVEPEKKGWQVVTYKDFALGWVNALQNRINNYYPKELRIIKDN